MAGRVENRDWPPDDPKVMRTEFYGTGFYPAESCTVAFPWVFTINNNARYGNQEGPFELQLGLAGLETLGTALSHALRSQRNTR